MSSSDDDDVMAVDAVTGGSLAPSASVYAAAIDIVREVAKGHPQSDRSRLLLRCCDSDVWDDDRYRLLLELRRPQESPTLRASKWSCQPPLTSDELVAWGQTVPLYGDYETPATDDELALEPQPSDAFKPTDGILFDNEVRHAKHQLTEDRRKAVLSRQWLHVAHAVQQITYFGHPVVAARASGDIFVGLTEASVPWGTGTTIGFDVIGNKRSGTLPEHTDVDPVCAADDGEDYRNNVFKVTADFERMAGTVSVHKMSGYGDDRRFVDAPRQHHTFSLKGWRSARLWVSMRSMEDTVELVKVTCL